MTRRAYAGLQCANRVMVSIKALCEAANLLTPEESVLVLIDHQPFQFAKLHTTSRR